MVENGTVPTFELWYDFRQKVPLGDYARFCVECLEAPYDHFWARLHGVTPDQEHVGQRLFASRVVPRVRAAVKV